MPVSIWVGVQFADAMIFWDTWQYMLHYSWTGPWKILIVTAVGLFCSNKSNTMIAHGWFWPHIAEKNIHAMRCFICSLAPRSIYRIDVACNRISCILWWHFKSRAVACTVHQQYQKCYFIFIFICKIMCTAISVPNH